MLPPGLFEKHRESIDVWLAHLASGALGETKETSLQGGFLERIFGDVLGYATMATARDGRWELVAEKTLLSASSADGAIGSFEKDTSLVLAPIELKGASQFLEYAKGRALTPVQQGWDYANKAPESRFVIVSNYRETRLYAKSRGSGAYELFRLEDLAEEAGFLRFVALLGRDAMLSGPSWDQSPLAQLLVASERTEHEITAKLYAEYRGLRARLFGELRRRHSNIPPEELLGYAQTILDRVLFLAFAEDRQLLPRDTLAHAYEHRDPYNPLPIWKNFAAVFRSVDRGSEALGIPAYNGGLFAENPDLDELEISDEMCRAFKELGDYDFGDDVSVDVLGHIFEQSITDLEQLRHEAREQADDGFSRAETVAQSKGTQKAPTKRKTEGIFYTPPFVTSFLVRETLGLTIADAWQRASDGRGIFKKDRIATWEAYQDELRTIRVLDPACGSGAFLIAAFDVLAHEFERANRGLAELRGKQPSLFDLTRTLLNENLFGIDKSGESVEIARLSLWLKTAERGKRLTFLDRNVRQGNSVVEDPLVDPWAFDWHQGRVAQSFLEPEPREGEDTQAVEAIDARWRGGFDVVIGNPPYVRQELLSEYKEHWRSVFSTYDGTADLFVYFFERGLKALKPGGRLGFIVSNKWLRGGYAEKLRAHFGRACTIDTLVDFGHAPIFPDADAFPCIITLRKATPAPDHAVRVTLYPRERLGKELVAAYVEQHAFSIPQRSLAPAGWTLEPPGVQALLEKLRANGVPLGAYTNTKPYRGVLTGYNAAFLVDNAIKERLCREDPRSTEVFKKYLRGQDIDRWSPQWAGYWLLLIKSSENHAWPWSNLLDEGDAESAFRRTFPAIHAHLKPLEKQLRKRTDKGRFWWELRSCTYYDLFERKRIIYPDIIWRGSFCVGDSGVYSNNTVYFLPSEDHWIIACLNSPAMWSYLWRNAQHAKDEALRMFSEFVVTIPIANAPAEAKQTVSVTVDHVMSSTRDQQQMAAGVLDVLRMEFEVDAPGNALSDFATLDSDGFVREVKKRRPKGSTLSPAGLRALRELYAAQTPPILAMRAAILDHESRIADAVHAAYGLRPDDLALLRATAPPRMPPGW